MEDINTHISSLTIDQSKGKEHLEDH